MEGNNYENQLGHALLTVKNIKLYNKGIKARASIESKLHLLWSLDIIDYFCFISQIYLNTNCTKMDSEVQRDGRILDLIDDAWREDKLPYEDVAIPLVGEYCSLFISLNYTALFKLLAEAQHSKYALQCYQLYK